MTPGLQAFLERVKRLHSIDLPDLKRVGLTMSPTRWASFRDDPVNYLIMAELPEQEAIWSLVEKDD